MGNYEKEYHIEPNPDAEGVIQHPAQILMSRRLGCKLPVSTKMLEPHIVHIAANLEQRQQMQKKYYDRGTKPLQELQKGDVVYYNRNRDRTQGIISSPTRDLSHGPINFKMNMETFTEIADNCTKQYELNPSFNSNTMKITTTQGHLIIT
ncbi:unnamed protein product [Clavelina lepadiformis]|uniref:Uncharacterized protein n=1 Tax=Clavelina lepadiformis TaxID=159417 RepID=A0ABP0EVR1_CLALP